MENTNTSVSPKAAGMGSSNSFDPERWQKINAHINRLKSWKKAREAKGLKVGDLDNAIAVAESQLIGLGYVQYGKDVRRVDTDFMVKLLADALETAHLHLEYCGYGDAWERECAMDKNPLTGMNVQETIEAALGVWKAVTGPLPEIVDPDLEPEPEPDPYPILQVLRPLSDNPAPGGVSLVRSVAFAARRRPITDMNGTCPHDPECEVWESQEGPVPVCQMGDAHLLNAYRMLSRAESEMHQGMGPRSDNAMDAWQSEVSGIEEGMEMLEKEMEERGMRI